MARRYFLLDVFTDQALAGNPLAVVLDGEGLPPERMQAIAAEFNLSETVFVLPPEAAASRARIRIFTRTAELPFAGHPTVGAAALIARLDGAEAGAERRFTLEEAVGPLACRVGAGFASFGLPRLPEVAPARADDAALAAALSLEPGEIGAGAHRPMEMSAGNPFTAVPVRDLATLARLRPRAERWSAAFGEGGHPAAFVYAPCGADADAAYRARVFAPDPQIGEDPATGSAAAAFIGVMSHVERPGDGAHRRVIEQGVEMGRPSRLAVDYVVEDGRVTAGSIGGAVVMIATGELMI